MRTRSGRPCTARKGARSNGLAVTGSAQAVGSVNRWHPYHQVVSCQLPDGLTFTARSHKRAPKLQCVLHLQSDILFACHVALRQPLNVYGVRRARFFIKPLASPPLGNHWVASGNGTDTYFQAQRCCRFYRKMLSQSALRACLEL